MTPGMWQPPSAASSSADGRILLEPLARALRESTGARWELTVERERLAGRSDIHIVRGQTADRPAERWVVKRPHPAWAQDDVDNPLPARDELATLERLDQHFRDLAAPHRVPRPIAHVPEIDALVMEFVPGPTIKDLLTYRSLARPGALLRAVAAAGEFLRHLHAIERHPAVETSLADEARAVLEIAEEKLAPLGLALPDSVRQSLEQVPARLVPDRRVRLHGDFGPSNIVLADHDVTVGLDASLSSVGRPEADLARFVALVSGMIRLAPEIVIPSIGRARSTLEARLLGRYYASAVRPALFELTYLHQLCRRWCRLRELAQQHGHGPRLKVKLGAIDRQIPLLMRRSEDQLVRSLGG